MSFDLRIQRLAVHYPVNVALASEPNICWPPDLRTKGVSPPKRMQTRSPRRVYRDVVQFGYVTHSSRWMTDRPRHQRRRTGRGPCRSCCRKISPESGHVAWGQGLETMVGKCESTIAWDGAIFYRRSRCARQTGPAEPPCRMFAPLLRSFSYLDLSLV
jgi:hypothetical protein